MKKSFNVRSIVVLTSVCAVISLMLAATNAITAPIIGKNQNAAANEALLVVMPEGKAFERLDISSYELPATVTEAYKEAGGGYVVKLTTAGYGSDFVVMCGVNSDGTVSGAVCLSSNETLGYEKTFGESFIGKNGEEVETVDGISGATKTTGAYRGAVRDAIHTATILGGGSVDIRSEEEVFAENLATALPAGEGAFTKVFLTEFLEGIEGVYAADNGKGAVCVVGGHFIGVDEKGMVVSGAEGALAEKITAQMVLLNASVETELDLTGYTGLPSALISATKTETGNYVLNMKGAGYGINGGDNYHPASGEYIYIKVSMTKGGKIIDCLTVSQAETPNIGGACAEEAFYGQFVGKTEADYETVDGISGATLTTNGYKKAILRAFEAVKILEGGVGDEE